MAHSITELRQKQVQIVAEARSLREEITDATPEARVAEIDAAFDKAMAEHDKVEGQIKREEQLAEREAALESVETTRRPNTEDRSGRNNAGELSLDEKRAAAFNGFLRRGIEDLAPEQRQILREMRAQEVGTDSKGGYLVPDQFQAELVKSLKAWGPMLDPGVTRMMMTATGASIAWPTMNDTSNEGAIIAENTQVSLSEIAFGTKTIGAYKYTSGVVLVSAELLQDSALNVESIVRDAMGERIGRIANKHLTIGDGSDKPNGVVNAATAYTSGVAAAALTFDNLIDLQHDVDPAYRNDPSVRWMFNDSTLKVLRKIKDGENRYIWQPADVKTGAPATILDKPYEINQAMASVGASAKSVAFGAFNRYVTRMVKEFAIRRLVERYADYDQVGFIGFTRLDGELLDTAAIKVLQHAAS